MKALWVIIRRIWARESRSLLRGTLLAITVLAAGIALLGLSGWFITAAGMAGLAGIGIAFDVFRPSAAVRFLALGRTISRYGERMLTHDATLRSLAALRVDLLRAVLGQPHSKTARYSTPEEVNRLTRDVDALDGVALRLVIPLLSALVAVIGTTLALWILAGPPIALVSIAFLLPAGLVAFAVILGLSLRPARLAHAGGDRFRRMVMELHRGRTVLTVAGELAMRRDHALATDRQARLHALEIDRIERTGGTIISVAMTFAIGAILAIGYWLAGGDASDSGGGIGPAFIALSVLAVLALGETIPPLRRGLADLGRMTAAARRVAPMLPEKRTKHEIASRSPATVEDRRSSETPDALLEFDCLTYQHPGAQASTVRNFNLILRAGETVAITGPSGSGKTTLLNMAAGLLSPDRGEVRLYGIPLCNLAESEIRRKVAMLPQRSALLSGTVMEALQMAKPDIGESEALAVLEAAGLARVLSGRGGPGLKLGESGSGLSGGERRRLALARVLLRNPDLLLLDEPTEGLDDAIARRVLAAMRDYLPQAAILIASHRRAELDAADRTVTLEPVQRSR
jgi:ATP-binding cassette subfamily C protein CydC